MSRKLKKVLIVTKPDDHDATDFGAGLRAFLERRGVEVLLCEHRRGTCVSKAEERGGLNLILVLGGDGTYIGVARRMNPLGVPVVGVNLGNVGFLAQLGREECRAWLEHALDHGFDVSPRIVLEYDVVRRGRIVRQGRAVNDVVVSRGELARLIRLDVACGGSVAASLRADGLIVSTPKGSSAYGVSAGGPLVHPGLRALCVTPVCPFLNSLKPLVMPADMECRITIRETASPVNLTEDGQEAHRLQPGDEIVVRGCGTDLLVVDTGQDRYFDRLLEKGFITEK